MNAVIRFIIPVFGVIGAFLFVMTLTDFEDQICAQCWPVEYFLYFSYFLLFVSIAATLIGAVVGALSNPASLKNTIIGLVVMGVVIGVSYSLASDQVFEYYKDISPAVSRWSGAGLYMLYIMVFGAIGAIVFSAINNLIKR